LKVSEINGKYKGHAASEEKDCICKLKVRVKGKSQKALSA
jgi:hypothetical protein